MYTLILHNFREVRTKSPTGLILWKLVAPGSRLLPKIRRKRKNGGSAVSVPNNNYAVNFLRFPSKHEICIPVQDNPIKPSYTGSNQHNVI